MLVLRSKLVSASQEIAYLQSKIKVLEEHIKTTDVRMDRMLKLLESK